MGRRNQGGRDSGLIGKLAKGGTFLYGLTQEVNAGNKARKAEAQTTAPRPYSSNKDITVPRMPRPDASNDAPPSYDAVMDQQPDREVSGTLMLEKGVLPHSSRSSPSPSIDVAVRPLPHPVILPQRRPNNKSRGFVRAYAPDLATYKGIDEATFLQFLKDFHKNSQASPIFKVVNVAAMGAGFAPSGIAMAVSAGVGIGSKIGSDYHERYRTNSYLDKANDEIFHPKNLHAMIMTFKPDSDSALLDVDGNSGASTGSRGGGPLSMLTQAAGSRLGGGSSSEGRFRNSDGTTQGEMSLPVAAELIFPANGALTPTPSAHSSCEALAPQKPPSAWKTTGKSIADYMDRRAQAKFAMQHGSESGLAIPGASNSTKFVSKYSDPSYINPISGGLSARRGGGHRNPQSTGPASQQQDQGKRGIRGLMAQKNVLYLLIAEIPSPEEVEALMNQTAVGPDDAGYSQQESAGSIYAHQSFGGSHDGSDIYRPAEHNHNRFEDEKKDSGRPFNGDNHWT